MAFRQRRIEEGEPVKVDIWRSSGGLFLDRQLSKGAASGSGRHDNVSTDQLRSDRDRSYPRAAVLGAKPTRIAHHDQSCQLEGPPPQSPPIGTCSRRA